MKEIAMLPVIFQNGAWDVDNSDPVLDGDDIDWLEDVDHLPQQQGRLHGMLVTIYLAARGSGYVRADSIPAEALPIPEGV
jgi:hypothetical protein